MCELFYKSLAELSRLLETGEISARELTEAVIGRTQKVEEKIHAFLKFDPEKTLAEAVESDQRRSAGNSRGPLDGIPVSLKDLICESGQSLTCGSRILENYISPYDATCVAKLKENGAILWGRLNMDEFAMGSSTENSAYQTTCKPWDAARIPGGSSGGSAAAVAAGETIAALGSDTGGSIRQPASLCGVVGLKPSYGIVSRYGLAAFASSLDQIGPITRTVEDSAILLQAIAGYDALDSTSCQAEVPHYASALNSPSRPWKLGLPREYFGEGLDAEIRSAVQKVIDFYKSEGCQIVEVSLPHTDLAVPVYYILAPAEASSNLARYDGVRYTHRSAQSADHVDLYFKSRGEGFGPEVKRRIILGTYVLSSGYYDAYYLRAQKVRTLIRNDFLEAFKRVDALITPVSPTAAFKIGEKSDDPLSMYLSDIYTLSVNLAGLPGISVPCGFNSENLPVGAQLIGQPYREAQLLSIAHLYDSSHRYGMKQPVI